MNKSGVILGFLVTRFPEESAHFIFNLNNKTDDVTYFCYCQQIILKDKKKTMAMTTGYS